MKTNIYKGYGWNKEFVGSCENGTIYSGYGLSQKYVGCMKIILFIPAMAGTEIL